PPKHWINLSGISIFEDVEGCHDENSQSVGGGFLAELTKEWEGVFLAIDTLGTKKTILRVSPVLARRSGMFAELYPLVKLGLGGTVGSGQQYISWIHEQDFVRLTLWLIGLSIPRSTYHACSPFPVTNAVFMEKLRRAVGISYGLPLPTPLAKVGSFFKGVDSSMLLGSVAATTRVTVEEGCNFDFPYISDAFSALIQSTLRRHYIMSFERLHLSEGWTVGVLGLAIILLALCGVVVPSPSFSWSSSTDLLGAVLSSSNIMAMAAQFLMIYVVAIAGAILLQQNLRAVIFMLPAVYLLTLVALILAGNAFFKEYNLEAVIFSLAIGLIISNFFTLPEWFKKALSTELYVKIGLV